MVDILRESFETDGNGTRYTTSTPEFSDGFGDFFTRTDEANIGSFYTITGRDGGFYFAGMDLDGEGAAGSQTLTFTGINIAGITDLRFDALFAEDDDGGNQDWDEDTSLIVKYSIDGGAFETLLAFEAAGGSTFNTEPLLDTDFDGVGDGAALTNTFTSFGADITGTGSSLDLVVEFNNLNAGDEDAAIDAITISSTAPTLVTVLDESFETNGNGTRYTTSTPEFTDGAGDFFTRTDESDIGSFYSLTGRDGGFYFAGMDLDGEGADGSQTLTFAGINIAGITDLRFDALFAEDDDGLNQDWDEDTSLIVKYSIDGGAFQTLLAFEAAAGSTFNTEPLLDTDFDGVGDGAALTNTFTSFGADITGTGSSLDLVFEFNNLNAGDEDVAIDAIKITGLSSGTAPTAGITIVESDGSTQVAEGGATDMISVVLESAPSADVTLTLATTGQTTLSAPSLTFTAANWNTAQTVTVTALDDSIFEGPHGDDITFTVSSGDTNYDGLSVAPVTVDITDNETPPLTRIHTIQGTTDTSPLLGQTVTVEAVVVGDFQDGDADEGRNLRGFFLQEEDADADADANTSEGIFVFSGDIAGDVFVGDKLRVTGTVDEFFGMTQLVDIEPIVVINGGQPLPTAANISLPVVGTTLNDNGALQPDLEAFEGMRVSFTDTLTITEMFQLDRFNEIKLVAGDRPYQFTQQNAPDVAGYQAHLAEVGARTITYDDGLNQQNAAIGNLDGFGPTFSSATNIRMGDTIDGLSGVLDYQWAGNSASGATWRVRATEDGENTFDKVNPRPAAPEAVEGSLKVATINVLNYFATIDFSGATTSNGNDPRGADTLDEFNRQTEKLVTAITAMDADILGLVEMENDFLAGSSGNAIESLVASLNAVTAPGTYAWVDPGTQFVGSDAIANGFIYKTDTVGIAAGTSVEILDDSDLPGLGITPAGNGIFDTNDIPGGVNRAVVAATFEELATGATFTAAVNHFKSKGSLNSTQAGNEDANDGAGRNNAVRLEAAIALEAWLATDPTGSGDTDALILGDLNSYAMEDPIAYLKSRAFTDLALEFGGADGYSYVFDGQVGTLDYAMANASLFGQVTGAVKWNANADEPDAIDYNTDFGRDTAMFDGTIPARHSDHDPIIVGLSLDYDLVRTDDAEEFEWTSFVRSFSGDGTLQSTSRLFDDGRLVVTDYADGVATKRTVLDQNDNFAFAIIVDDFDSEGGLTRKTRTNDPDDGREIVTDFVDGERSVVTVKDLADSFVFDTIVRTYDDAGAVAQETRTLDPEDGRVIVTDFVDGIRTEKTVFDAADNYPWAERIFAFDAAGERDGPVIVIMDDLIA